MNCQNCGAPMELFARRRYFFCRHCGTFHFLDAPEVDGLQVLARRDDARTCAVCSGPLAESLLDRAHSVEYCERCRGVLMARRTFAEVITRRRAWATGPPTPAIPLDRVELERVINCPACHARMEVHPYFGPGNVVMDSCGACDLVWLDFGEMQQIVDAPGRDRGMRDAPPPGIGPSSARRDDAAGEARPPADLLDALRDLLTS